MSDSNSSSLSGGHIHPEGLKDYDEEDSEDEEHNNHQYLVSRRKNRNEKKNILVFFFQTVKGKNRDAGCKTIFAYSVCFHMQIQKLL